MALDPRYVLAPSLQEFFIDKDSGLPMSGGAVYFFQDNARTIPKDVFELSGMYPGYSYTVLPNPSILSAVGTFQDASGNDILPYYYPFDPDSNSPTFGEIQLYYIEVYNSDGVLQFTREGFPNETSDNISSENIFSFVPNGQFLLHDNIPPSTANGFIANKISQAVTTIAQGGWTFERNSGSTAVDLVSFPRYGSSTTVPTGNPRYAVQIQTTSAGSDTRKDLCLKFPNVNTFASDEQAYNLYFEAESLGSSVSNVQILLRKYFGTGGTPSATTETPITTISLQNGSIQKYNVEIIFGTNEAESIGTNDDDYVQIVIRLPPTGVQTAVFTDFALTINNTELMSFPTETNAEQLDESTAGWFPTPDPDGFDLYLPAVLTQSGLAFSDADIGKIFASTLVTLPIGELDCDGTQYLTEDYSSAGIPYARLQAKWFNSTFNINYFGNGVNYASANYTNVNSGSNTFRLNLTSPGAGTIAGFNNTGFTFANITTGQLTGCVGYLYNDLTPFTSTGIYIIDNVLGTQTPPTAGTSGFSIGDAKNDALFYHSFYVVPTTPAGLGGKYFTFTTSSGLFYMWFTVNVPAADPAPGGTGIKVNLLSTYTQAEVARCIKDAITGYQDSLVSPVIGSSVVAGSYFTFVTPAPSSVTYYVWYTKDGSGTDPQTSVSQSLKIKVEILSTDTIAQVVTKTIIAINKKYFALPDLRSQFLRGWDKGAGIDLFEFARYTNTNDFDTGELGTFAVDQIASHLHASGTLAGTVPYTITGLPNVGTFLQVINSTKLGNVPVTISGNTALTGTYETTPINFSIRWVVKY